MNSFSTLIRTHIIPILLMTIAVVLVYGRALNHEFVTSWDDGLYVVNNSAAHGFSLENIRNSFSRFYVGNYAPLHIISYMLDYELWGMQPRGYLLTNLLLHLTNGVLLYALILSLSAGRWSALAGVMVFLLHPVQVESVVWVSQRKNVLAMLFFLAAFLFYRSSRTSERPLPAYGAALLAYCLALLSKSVVVMFPLALFLYELCYASRDRKLFPSAPLREQALADRSRSQKLSSTLLRIIPYCLVAAVVAGLAIWSQSPEEGGGRVPWWGGSPFATLCNMPPVLLRYLKLLFWPLNLNAVYDMPVKTGVDGAVAAAAIAVASLVVIGFLLFRRNRQLFFWYALFFIGLLPVSQIVPLTTLMNDRYLYFPMIGFAVLLALVVDSLLKKNAGKIQVTVLVLFTVICLLYGFASRNRTAVWRDNITLWADTVSKAPGNADSWYNVGRNYQVLGRLDEALTAYLRALALHPYHLKALDNLAVIYPASPQFDQERFAVINDLVRNYPPYPYGVFLLGHGGAEWSHLQFHRDLFQKLLRFNPASKVSLLGLGNVYLRAGDLTAAGLAFDRAAVTGADRLEVEYNKACLETLKGNYSNALRLLGGVAEQGLVSRGVLERDPYLVKLRALPEFARLMAVVERF